MPNEKKYNPVTSKIADELEQIVGARYIIYGDEEKLEPYSHDEVSGAEYAHMPEVVVRPRTAHEISKIMKLANPHIHMVMYVFPLYSLLNPMS